MSGRIGRISDLTRVGWAVLAVAVVALTPGAGSAYERYNDGCQDCHGSFTASGYLSQVTGAAWPSSLHQVHRNSSYMDSDCDLCHVDGDNDDPYVGLSNGTAANPGYGCSGCHGSATGGTAPSGIPLRSHHVYAGISECGTACHDPLAPVSQESTTPPYYGTVDTRVASACNDDSSTSEDWNNDGQGLDNDGDLQFDAADPGCQSGFVFHDGFVSGGLGEWVAVASH